MKLPEEMLAEIVSHVDGLDGLQIAFTSRALYKLFNRLVLTEYHLILLRHHLFDMVYIWVTKGRRHVFRNVVEILFQDGISDFNDIDELQLDIAGIPSSWGVWALQSLLVRAKKRGWAVRRLQITTRVCQRSLPVNAPGPETAAWHRAMQRLCETALELDGMMFDVSSIFHSPRFAITTPTWKLSPTVKAGLTSYALRGVPRHNTPYFGHLDKIVTLSSKSLTELRMHEVLRSPEEWVAALSAWDLRQLTSLQMTGVKIPLDALASFLARHPTLSTALLYVQPAIGTKPTPRPDCGRSTSLLQKLVCTPTIIESLRRYSISFPNLARLELNDRPSSAFKLAGSLAQLIRIFRHLGRDGVAPNLKYLHLDLAYRRRIKSWLKSAATTPLEGETLPLLDMISHHTFDSDPPLPSSRSTPNLPEALGSLVQVEFLHLSIQDKETRYGGTLHINPPPTHIQPHLIVDFLSAFPSLRLVTIDKVFEQDRSTSTRIKPSQRDAFWPEVAEVWTKCRRLEELEIVHVGAVQQTAKWKRGDAEPIPGFEVFRDAF